MIIVTRSKITDKITKLERPCKYSDVPTDKEKWVHDLNYMPIPYDLMFLKLKNHTKIKSGWWDGNGWKGLRLKDEDEVVAWKRNLDFE